VTAKEIRASSGRQLAEVIATGEALLRVKEVLPHGEFGEWLAAEFGWAERTAQNYMRATEAFGENPQRVADLPLRSLYTLAAQPPSARNRVLELTRERSPPSYGQTGKSVSARSTSAGKRRQRRAVRR